MHRTIQCFNVFYCFVILLFIYIFQKNKKKKTINKSNKNRKEELFVTPCPFALMAKIFIFQNEVYLMEIESIFFLEIHLILKGDKSKMKML